MKPNFCHLAQYVEDVLKLIISSIEEATKNGNSMMKNNVLFKKKLPITGLGFNESGRNYLMGPKMEFYIYIYLQPRRPRGFYNFLLLEKKQNTF